MDIVTPTRWGSTGPAGPASMTLPSRGVWIHHTVTTPTGDPYADARTIERIGIDRFGRGSYSWLIHPSGVVMQMQGHRIGAHTGGHNSTSHGLAFIGNHDVHRPTAEALAAAGALLRHGHRRGWWRQARPLGGHRDAAGASTACPGRHLYRLVPTLHEEGDMPLTSEEIDRIAVASARAVHNQELFRTGVTIGQALNVTRQTVAALVPQIAALASRDPASLTDEQVETLAHGLADGLDDRVAARTVELLAERLSR